MKVGLFTTNQQYADTDMVGELEAQYAMVRLARDRGWDSLFTGQHYLNEGNNKQLQIVPFLSRLMAEAGEMTVGMGVLLLNLHNPVYVAETVASMDILARGNFVFGVGLGYREVEFDAFGVRKGQRVKRFEAYLDVVQRLWSGEAVTYEDETCKLDGVCMNIRPVQQPSPPLWIAANNDAAVRRAARLGDAWMINPHSTVETVRRQLVLYRDELAKADKPFPSELPTIKEVFCAKNRAAALEMAGPYLFGKYQDYAKWGQDDAMPDNESFHQDFDSLLRDRFVLGSPEDCYEQLRPYWEELNVNHLIFSYPLGGAAAIGGVVEHPADVGRIAAGPAQGIRRDNVPQLSAMAASVGERLKASGASLGVSESSCGRPHFGDPGVGAGGLGILPRRRRDLHRGIARRLAGDRPASDAGIARQHGGVRPAERPHHPGNPGRHLGSGRNRRQWPHRQSLRRRRRARLHRG